MAKLRVSGLTILGGTESAYPDHEMEVGEDEDSRIEFEDVDIGLVVKRCNGETIEVRVFGCSIFEVFDCDVDTIKREKPEGRNVFIGRSITIGRKPVTLVSGVGTRKIEAITLEISDE